MSSMLFMKAMSLNTSKMHLEQRFLSDKGQLAEETPQKETVVRTKKSGRAKSRTVRV